MPNIKTQPIKKDSQLPSRIERLHRFILVASKKLKVALDDAQDLALILLEAEKKLGEMLDEITKNKTK